MKLFYFSAVVFLHIFNRFSMILGFHESRVIEFFIEDKPRASI